MNKEWEEHTLYKMFAAFNVSNVLVCRHKRTGRSLCVAFVEFGSQEEMRAFAEMSGCRFNGTVLQIQPYPNEVG